jgi:hypothetical protein
MNTASQSSKPIFPSLSLGAVVVLLIGCGGTQKAVTITPTPVPTPIPSSCTTSAITINHTSTTLNAPQLVVLNTQKYPNALCNDGSAAAYVLRPGTGIASTRWIFSLQGGGECYDQATCSNRSATMPTLVSTLPYQANPSSAFGQAGILSSNISTDPDFYDASMVQVLYCSSDDWSGAKASTSAYNPSDPTTWNFEGHAIVKDVLADLNASHGLSSATEILLTGQSAGGLGVFDNVNTIASLIPSTVRLTAYSDAAFGNVIDNFSPTGSAPDYLDTVNTPNEIAKRVPGIALWNGTGDAACAAAAGTNTTAQVGCYSGQQLLASGGGITLPMLVSVSEKDTNQLSTDGVPSSDLNSQNFTAAESGYISYFASQMRLNLATTNASVSIFSPDIFAHVEATDPTLFVTPQTFPSASLTLQQAVSAWYKTPCSAQRNIAN